MNPFRRIICKCAHIYYEKLSAKRKTKGTILMLHWVNDGSDEGNLYSITIGEFKELLQWLKRKNTIRLENWKQEDGFYALTIDDVPKNFYLNAYPLLKKEEIPFTIFVNVTLLDKEGYITSEQLKEMSDCWLCTVGSHGVKHSMYHRMSVTEAQIDLEESKRILSQLVSKPIEMYAFPYGSYYACGFIKKHFVTKYYKYAFCTIAASITEPQTLPDYFIPRINVDSKFIKQLNNV